jgi:hypothetical protein
MADESLMDEVTDLIANVEMHRKEIESESGLDASRTYALGRLQQALQQEQELAQQDASRAAIVEALNAEIRRLGTLRASGRPPQQKGGGGGGGGGPGGQNQRNFRRGGGGGGQRHSGKQRGRRPMGGRGPNR